MWTNLKNRGKSSIHFCKTLLYHRLQKEKAQKKYASIVTQHPDRALTRVKTKLISEYSRDVFGSSYYSPWLEVYTAYRGDFLEGWIPHNYIVSVLVPKWTRYPHLDAKIISRRVLSVEQIPDVAYFFNGTWLDHKYQTIPKNTLKDQIFAQSDTVYVKLDRSWAGRGIWKLSKSEFEPERLSGMGDFVVQLPIRQHPFFDQFSSDSVATIRVLTVKESAEPARKVAAYLRLGRQGDTIVRSDRDVRVPLIDDDGRLGNWGSDPNWGFLAAHPDSGTAFEGKIIPAFKRAVGFCEKLHNQTPITVLIGWDVTIDALSEVVLMEFNQGRVGTRFPEASIGPNFKGLGWEHVWKSA